MKIGLLAYSTNTGLGYQTHELFKNLNPTKTLIADLFGYNKMLTHHERFPGARIAQGFPSDFDADWLTDDVDAVIVCENPLNYNIFAFAQNKGVKVVQQFNPEFLDYWRHPEWPKPTVLANPSVWLIDRVRSQNFAPTIHLPVPYPTVQPREIKELKTFIHIIGRPAVYDRNGTLIYLEAAAQLKDFKHKVFIQVPKDKQSMEYYQTIREFIYRFRGRLEIVEDIEDSSQMYSEGEVLVLPRRYGGLCLPMQEALAYGIPVIMPACSPNEVLPEDWLVGGTYNNKFRGHADIDLFKADTKLLTEKMRLFATPEYLQNAHQQALQIAANYSWEKLENAYMSALKGIV